MGAGGSESGWNSPCFAYAGKRRLCVQQRLKPDRDALSARAGAGQPAMNARQHLVQTQADGEIR